MEIVIKISDELYDLIQDKLDFNGDLDKHTVKTLMLAVDNGKPLPKGHGRLIDIDKFLKRVEGDRKHECYLHSWTIDDVLQRLDSWYAPIIIEADQESEE